MKRICLISCFLTACGVADVGAGAATAAKLKADEAKQAKETMDRMQQKIEATNQTINQRTTEEADKAR